MNCPRCQTWIAGDRVEEEQKFLSDGSLNIHNDARCADVLKAQLEAAHLTSKMMLADINAQLDSLRQDYAALSLRWDEQCDKLAAVEQEREHFMLQAGWAINILNSSDVPEEEREACNYTLDLERKRLEFYRNGKRDAEDKLAIAIKALHNIYAVGTDWDADLASKALISIGEKTHAR
jgi:septal ring factor EnvC (AmiA/AmiB activator)